MINVTGKGKARRGEARRGKRATEIGVREGWEGDGVVLSVRTCQSESDVWGIELMSQYRLF